MALCGRAGVPEEKNTDEWIASVIVETPRLKCSWRQSETRNHEAGLVYLKSAPERLWVKV